MSQVTKFRPETYEYSNRSKIHITLIRQKTIESVDGPKSPLENILSCFSCFLITLHIRAFFSVTEKLH